MNSYTVTTKQAIGRHGIIGSLYDIRSDQFEGGNLFNKQVPSSIVLTTDSASSDYLVDDNQSQSETLNNLNIEGSMKLSLMSGLLKAEGSAKYLNQTKTDSRTVRVTFTFKAKTKHEHLQINTTDLLDYVSSYGLQNPYATHCVIGITYGACVAATFEQTTANSKQAEEIQGDLAAEFKKGLINVEGSAKLRYDDKKDSNTHSMKITLSGDILIDKIPNSIKDVYEIFEKVPSMLAKLNDGKGKPIEFELYPLHRIAEIFKCELKIERIIKEVASAIVSRIENIFEEIIRAKRIFNDFIAKIQPWEDWLPPEWTRVIYEKRTELAGHEIHTQRELASLIQKIRRGEADEEKMVQLVDNFDLQNPCSKRSIREFLRQNRKIDAKMRSLGEFDPEAHTDEEKKPNTKILLKEFTSIQDFVLHHNNAEVYLLHISNEWEEKDKENWYKQLRFFCHLLDEHKDNSKRIARVIDHDLHTDLYMKPDNCVIFHAHDGAIKSRDYYCTAWETLSSKDIREIKIANKFMFLNNKAIEAWHKHFIKRSPKGQLNEEDFISAFKELYRSGNPAPYCSHIFHKIDNDHSGTIEFNEFMSAISLSLLADIQQQFKFVFKMCTHDDSAKVYSDELINFIELVAELEGGEDAVDPAAAQMVVNKIIENERTERGITEEEFLAKVNEYDLAITFLPLLCKKLSGDNVGSIRKRHADVTQDEILKQHRTILEKLHRGILTKSSYMEELKTYNPKGNPASFCNYIFKGITKGRNRMINFELFLDTHRLLEPKDLDQALTAAFNLCDIDCLGAINLTQIEVFVKIIAELNEGQIEMDPYNPSAYALKHPKSIAKAIMGQCGKKNSEQIKCHEFVECCKNDYWLRKAILPLKTEDIHNRIFRHNHSKTHINIATIGHMSHGKTTLTAAIIKILSGKNQTTEKSYKKIMSMIKDKAHPSQKQCHVVAVEYETDARHYVHFDCAGHPKFIKNMISTAAVIDGAILVVDATEGIMQQTREHLKIVRKFGVKNIVTFLNKTKEVNQKKLEEIEMELKDLLAFDENNEDIIPIIRASGSLTLEDETIEIDADAIEKLLHAIDVIIPSPNRNTDNGLLMSIMNIHNIFDRGIVVEGVVQRGTVCQGDQIDVVGYGCRISTTVTKIQTFNKQIDRAKHGDYVGLLLQGLTRKQIRRGQVISMHTAVTLHKRFIASIYVFKKEEGGRHTPFFKNYQPHVLSKTCSVTTNIILPNDFLKVMPGDKLQLTFQLFKGMVIEQNDPILICEGDQLIATGAAIQILD